MTFFADYARNPLKKFVTNISLGEEFRFNHPFRDESSDLLPSKENEDMVIRFVRLINFIASIITISVFTITIAYP